jgi:N-acetylated-alpha-linked acidic dipeptidase
MPLSARDAAEILRRLRGPAVPSDAWQGVAIADTYRVGPGPVRVRLQVENTRERRTIRNIIGTLEGTDERAQKVILSNHHDAWVYGAVDPSSGTATMISLARALGRLAREGLRPRRTIVFGEWDSEEYTLTGSTEWGEEHEADLVRNGIVCINVDASASGAAFSASASPTLGSVIRAVAAAIPDPGAPGKTVAESWREKASAAKNVRSYASGERFGEELPVAVLGSGSDYTVFFNRLGIASMDILFDGPYGVYHSVYDGYGWMSRHGDPGFRYHAAMARLAGVLALRFANADVLPFDPSPYGREIAAYAKELAAAPAGRPLAPDLARLSAAAERWSRESKASQDAVAAELASGRADAARLRSVNSWLLGLERAVSDDGGLPDRPWFRHLIYAPLPSYAAETLPAIREAAVRADATAARGEIARLEARLERAAQEARRIRP